MNVKMPTLVIASAMVAVLGAACIAKTEGPSLKGEQGVVGLVRPAGSGEPVEPTGATNRPVTILDTIDPNMCSFIHNINACFSDGRPPADIPMGDFMEAYFMAKQDLSERTGKDHLGARIKSVERVEWSDASLGRPEAGAFYARVITPGFRLVLESDGALHTYHTSLDRAVFVE